MLNTWHRLWSVWWPEEWDWVTDWLTDWLTDIWWTYRQTHITTANLAALARCIRSKPRLYIPPPPPNKKCVTRLLTMLKWRQNRLHDIHQPMIDCKIWRVAWGRILLYKHCVCVKRLLLEPWVGVTSELIKHHSQKLVGFKRYKIFRWS